MDDLKSIARYWTDRGGYSDTAVVCHTGSGVRVVTHLQRFEWTCEGDFYESDEVSLEEAILSGKPYRDSAGKIHRPGLVVVSPSDFQQGYTIIHDSAELLLSQIEIGVDRESKLAAIREFISKAKGDSCDAEG